MMLASVISIAALLIKIREDIVNKNYICTTKKITKITKNILLPNNFTCLITLKSHSQRSAIFTVTSVLSALTMQNYIKVCNKYLKN